MTERDLLKQALEALELLAWYENPATKVQVRKPRGGGPIVTMYPHKVATEAAAPLRERLAQPEPEPVAYDKTELNAFVQNLYDEKMREGKHGHYETMFHVVHQAIKRVTTPPRIEQEPVAYYYPDDKQAFCVWPDGKYPAEAVPLYTTPPRREWVGLTDEEVKRVYFGTRADFMDYARAIEAKLKEKNA